MPHLHVYLPFYIMWLFLVTLLVSKVGCSSVEQKISGAEPKKTIHYKHTATAVEPVRYTPLDILGYR